MYFVIYRTYKFILKVLLKIVLEIKGWLSLAKVNSQRSSQTMVINVQKKLITGVCDLISNIYFLSSVYVNSIEVLAQCP